MECGDSVENQYMFSFQENIYRKGVKNLNLSSKLSRTQMSFIRCD